MTVESVPLDSFIKNFKAFECEEGLFDVDCCGVQVYPYIRIPLYYYLTEHYGLNEKQVNNLKLNRSKILYSLISILKGLLTSIFPGNKTCDILIVEHPKKTLSKGRWIDKYSYYLCESLLKKYKVKVLHHPNSTHRGGVNVYPKGVCFYYDSYIFKRKLHEVFLRKNKNIIDTSRYIHEKISSVYDVSENLSGLIKSLVAKAVAEEKIAENILKKMRPSVVGSVVAYGHAAAFHSVSKKLGIKNFELQHGAVTDNHLGYSYPPGKNIAIFPEYFLSYGDYWSDNASFPIDKSKILSVGCVDFETIREQASNKSSECILFVSQNVNYKEMLVYAMHLAKLLPDEMILFKLHPKLCNDVAVVGDILDNNSAPNLGIISQSEVTIGDLLIRSKCQIGVFSTAIYEGIGIGVPTVILQLNGWQVMKKLEEMRLVKFVSTVNELLAAFEEIVRAEQSDINYDSDKMFKYNAAMNVESAVVSILGKEEF